MDVADFSSWYVDYRTENADVYSLAWSSLYSGYQSMMLFSIFNCIILVYFDPVNVIFDSLETRILGDVSDVLAAKTQTLLQLLLCPVMYFIIIFDG